MTRQFRRRILPALWLLIGLAIATSLVKLAFLNGSSETDSDSLQPTGAIPPETIAVETGTVNNVLTLDGTIELDAAKAALATRDGQLVKVYVKEGSRVKRGAPLAQLRMEGDPDGGTTYVTVLAPVAGTVGGFAFSAGDPVTKGATVASVQPSTYKASASIRALDRYRLVHRPKSATVTINGGPAPFTCTSLTIGDAATTPPTPAGGGEPIDPMAGQATGESSAEITCVVPGNVVVFDGLDMTMEIAAGSANKVLLVPVTAVRGLVSAGTVWVLGDTGPAERAVKLGITDGKVIQVASGLKAGESVLRYVPGSSAPPQGDPGGQAMVMGQK